MLTQRAYTRYFGVRNPLSKQAILNLFRRFEQQGAVSDLLRDGRPRSGRSQENIQYIYSDNIYLAQLIVDFVDKI